MAETMRRIRDVERLIHGAKFGTELALPDKVELLCEGVVRMLEHLHLRAMHVVAWGKGCGCTGAECEFFSATAAGGLDSMGDKRLDNAVRRAWEVESILHLHPVGRRDQN